jgi:hypothetical protein
MIRKNGAGDLQLGEKYVSYVLLLFSELTDVHPGIVTWTSSSSRPLWA